MQEEIAKLNMELDEKISLVDHLKTKLSEQKSTYEIQVTFYLAVHTSTSVGITELFTSWDVF